MSNEEYNSSLSNLANTLSEKRKDAVDLLYNFIASHPTEKPLNRKTLEGLFINASIEIDANPSTVSLTAKDCMDIAEESKLTGKEPTVNTAPYNSAIANMKTELDPYCKAPELEDVIKQSLNAYMSTLITGSRTVTTQPRKPVRKEPEEQSYFPMVHGKATDALSNMTSKGQEINPISGALTITHNGVKETIPSFNDIAGALGISTHKLLSTAMVEFTQRNNVGSNKRSLQDLRVAIPLKEYAKLRKYDVEEHEKDTPEEQKKEKERAENELRNARKSIRKDLDVLYNSSLSWSEKVRGREKDFMDVHLIGAKGIRNGYIYMSFTEEMGEYLVQLPLTQYPPALIGVDERNPNAYPMGLQMVEHYNMDSNILQGTFSLLKVSTLLTYTKLPSINDSSVKKNGYENRIKEPFERALDVLTSSGVLADWYYSHPKGERLTDEEATNFSDYEEWANTLVCYTLKDAPDQTARLETRAEEKAQQEKKPAKTTKKKKPAPKKK